MTKQSLKVSEVVARDIVSSIADGDPGDMLESEADMLVSFGVSRGTLREALRLLETQGLVQLKPGPRGGPVVGRPSPEYLGKTISMFLRMMGVTYGDVCECVVLIAPRIAELAARRCDKGEAEIALAPWLDDSETSPDNQQRRQANFHSVIYQLAGNRILTLVMNAIESVFLDHLLIDVNLDCDYIIAQSDSSARIKHTEHQDIAKSIVAKKHSKARTLMEEHLQDIIESCRENLPAKMDQSVEWR